MRGSSAQRCISACTSAPGTSLRRMLLKLDPLRASSCKLCRSAHTSDSNELPPDSKTPTTFHMRRPTFRSAPNAPWVLIHKQFADDDFIQSRRKHSTGDKAHFVMDVGA